MPECDNCGAHVSQDYARVFSGNDGVVDGCRDCLGTTEILNGATVTE